MISLSLDCSAAETPKLGLLSLKALKLALTLELTMANLKMSLNKMAQQTLKYLLQVKSSKLEETLQVLVGVFRTNGDKRLIQLL